MAHTYNYSILTAVPDARRGERVNVGVAVYLADRLDVRLSGVAKLRALTGEGWDQFLVDAARDLRRLYKPGDRHDKFSNRVALLHGAVTLSDPGWFSIESVIGYEDAVHQVLRTLVDRPRPPSRPKSTRINTEIARQLKRTKVLASSAEGLDTHKVVRYYPISAEEELTADFAAKNGRYYVVATLDLRMPTVGRKDACEKAIVLDKAKQLFGDETRLIGVYAGVQSARQYRPSIELLRDYSEVTFNWLEHDQRANYLALIHQAVSQPGALFSPNSKN